ADDTYHRLTDNKVNLGAGLNVAGAVPMAISGITRGNIGETVNGTLNAFSSAALLAKSREKDEQQQETYKQKPLPVRVFNWFLDAPSRFSAFFDNTTSIAGFLGGAQDFFIRSRGVPLISGALQMLASFIY